MAKFHTAVSYTHLDVYKRQVQYTTNVTQLMCFQYKCFFLGKIITEYNFLVNVIYYLIFRVDRCIKLISNINDSIKTIFFQITLKML